MASVEEYLVSQESLWGRYQWSGKYRFEVSEIWRATHPSGAFQTYNRVVEGQDLESWLCKTDYSIRRSAPDPSEKCVLRLVWIPRNLRVQSYDISKNLYRKLCQNFRHEFAQLYLQASYAEIHRTTHPETGESAFVFCIHPKLALTWSQDDNTSLTSVVCTIDSANIDTFRRLLSCNFIQSLSTSPLMPAVVCSILLYQEVLATHKQVKVQVNEMEARTGHHIYKSRSVKPALGDLLDLSARMSGCGAKIAGSLRKLGVIEELKVFIREQFAYCVEGFGSSVWTRSQIQPIMQVIERRARLQKLDADSIDRRVQTQKDAVSRQNYSIRPSTPQRTRFMKC